MKIPKPLLPTISFIVSFFHLPKIYLTKTNSFFVKPLSSVVKRIMAISNGNRTVIVTSIDKVNPENSVVGLSECCFET